ncbi:MAG: histidinol-phosphatase HisJ family protein [Actinobacteria bacterium]|nr:histidinol-phosphatase HisJ family protein [Actinomycetota bacterium]
MSDYHLHLHPHFPTPGSPPMGVYPPGYIDQYVETALSRGVTELGFTEHLYRCVESAPILGTWWEHDPDPRLSAEMERYVTLERNLSLEAYVDVVLDAKQRGLPVKLGLEVDFEPGTVDSVLDLLAGYPFDFLIGSVHWIGAWSIDRPSAAPEFARRGVRRAYEQYFELETELAASEMVDVLAHADLVKKLGIHPKGSLDDLYTPLVAAAAASGVAVEVSSAGLRKPVGEIYPAPRLLRSFRAAGVPITLASDAHIPDEAGWGHIPVVRAARAAGYTHHLRFSDRKRYEMPLPHPTGDDA